MHRLLQSTLPKSSTTYWFDNFKVLNGGSLQINLQVYQLNNICVDRSPNFDIILYDSACMAEKQNL